MLNKEEFLDVFNSNQTILIETIRIFSEISK